MADDALVPLADLKAHLGVASGDTSSDTLLGTLTTRVREMFERACNRDTRPFQAAQTARTEVLDGSGSAAIWLDYKPAAITSIALGYDSALPYATLDPASKLVVVWGATSRRVQRVDGGHFGPLGAPRFVQFVYDAAADLPEAAKIAVMAGIAFVWRRRGSEEASTERTGAYESQLLTDLISDPTWKQGVALFWEPRV